jgi:hypothetical protein
MALLPASVGAILAIMGGAVSVFRQREGGILLLAGGSVAALGWLIAMGEVLWGRSLMADEIAWGYLVVDFLWWEAIILSAGLIASPTTRKTLKQFRQEGWLP